MSSLNKKQIEELLPHREPMLLIDELYDILNNQYKIDEPFLGGMFDEDI